MEHEAGLAYRAASVDMAALEAELSLLWRNNTFSLSPDTQSLQPGQAFKLAPGQQFPSMR